MHSIHSVWSYDLVLHKVLPFICSWCMFVSSFVLGSVASNESEKFSASTPSCFFLLVLVQAKARQRGLQQRLQRMPLHPPTTPPRQGGSQSWHLTCQIPQGILFLTSLFSGKSWQGVVLFEILCPQWFLYSSRLPRHEFKREVAPSPALHCSCSFMAKQSRIQGACFHLPALMHTMHEAGYGDGAPPIYEGCSAFDHVLCSFICP